MNFQPMTETFVLPSGASATVREMTGQDEDLLMNEKLVKAGKAQHQLLGGLLIDLDGSKPTSADVLNMWSADRTAVLLHARVLSYGPELTSAHECENKDCKAEFQITLDHVIKDLVKRPCPEDPNALLVTLPSGKTATIRSMRGSDEAKLLTARQRGELMTELLFTRLIDVDGVDDRGTLREILRNGPVRDRNALRQAMESNEFGYQTQIDATCPVCQTEQRVDVLGLRDFFFPASPGQ